MELRCMQRGLIGGVVAIALCGCGGSGTDASGAMPALSVSGEYDGGANVRTHGASGLDRSAVRAVPADPFGTERGRGAGNDDAGTDARDAASAPESAPPTGPMDPASPVGEVPAARACALPAVRPLSLPTDRVTGTLAGPSRIDVTQCGATAGPDDVYPLHIAARTGVEIRVTDLPSDARVVLALRRVCDDASTEIACHDGADRYSPTFPLVRRVLEPGDYAVVVDARDAGPIAYGLTVQAFQPPLNARCEGAEPLAPGATIAMNTDEGGSPTSACLANGAGQRFYAITIPAGQRAIVHAESSVTAPALRLLDHCGASACLGWGQCPPEADLRISVAGADNRESTPRTVILAVSADATPHDETYQLSVRFEPIDAPLALNARCDAARALVPGVILTSETLASAASQSTACDADHYNGKALYYALTVPAGMTLSLRATPAASGAPNPLALRLLDDCASSTCALFAHGTRDAGAQSVDWTNTGTDARAFVLAVSARYAETSGAFDLAYELLAPALNGACDLATLLDPSAPASAQNPARGALFRASCMPTEAPTLFYRVMVPAGATLTATATETTLSASAPLVRVLDACGAAPACLVDAVRTARFTNTGTDPRDVLLALSAQQPDRAGPYDLAVQITPPAPAP